MRVTAEDIAGRQAVREDRRESLLTQTLASMRGDVASSRTRARPLENARDMLGRIRGR